MKATTDRCLKAMRKMEAEGLPITSQALVEALDIQPTGLSRALDIAAGWISTLRRYGLLRSSRAEKVQGPVRRLQVYELTDWGIRYKVGKKASRAGRPVPALRIAANPKSKKS